MEDVIKLNINNSQTATKYFLAILVQSKSFHLWNSFFYSHIKCWFQQLSFLEENKATYQKIKKKHVQ